MRSNGLHPEDTERLTRYADHLQHSPLPGHRALEPQARRRYLRAVGAWPSVRDCAIALLPLYVGTRIAEIRALDVADVRLSTGKGEIHLARQGREVPDRGRAHPELGEALAVWLEERRSEPGAGSPALFLSGSGTGLPIGVIRRRFYMIEIVKTIGRPA